MYCNITTVTVLRLKNRSKFTLKTCVYAFLDFFVSVFVDTVVTFCCRLVFIR